MYFEKKRSAGNNFDIHDMRLPLLNTNHGFIKNYIIFFLYAPFGLTYFLAITFLIASGLGTMFASYFVIK